MKKTLQITQLLPLLVVGLIAMAIYTDYEIYNKLFSGSAIILGLLWTKNNQTDEKNSKT